MSIIVSTILQQVYTANGVPIEKLYDELMTSLGAVFIWHLLTIVGFAVGGYVAASTTSTKSLISAGASAGLVLLVLPVQYLGVYPNPFPVWSQVLGFMTPVPSALLGGWLLLRQGAAK